MNRSVPMLLAIIVLLVVVVLVVLVYNITLTNRLSQGLTPSGTVGGQVLTGVKAPTDVLTPASGGTEAGHTKTVVLPANAGKGQAAHPGRAGGSSGRAGGRGRGGPGPAGERGR